MVKKELKTVETNLAECCNEPLNFRDLADCLDHPMQGAKCEECETIYERRTTGKVMYVHETGRNEVYCGTCGESISVAQVAHPIHDGMFPLSGSGKCNYETVPYCPNCEEKPDFNGSIVKERR